MTPGAEGQPPRSTGTALVVIAGLGACWGLAEAVVSRAHGGADPLSVACFYPLVLLALGLPTWALLSALPWTRPSSRRIPWLAALLTAGAVALPLAIWASQRFVHGVPLVSPTNAGIGLLAFALGLLPGWVVARLARRLPALGVPGACAALVLWSLCALRCADTLFPGAPGPWPDNRARVGPRPNVVLIVLDTLRADHLSSYGYARTTSPRLDALDAVRFQHTYAPAHWTPPSTATLLSGLHPIAHQTNAIAAVLPDEVETLAQMLGGAGYVSGYFTGNFAVSGAFGFTRGADWVVSERSLPPYRLHPSSLGRLLVAKVSDLTRADELNDWVIPFLDSVRERSFFLYLHYKDPHQPYDPPAPHDEAFDPGFAGRRITDPAIRDQWPISEAERHNMIARYDGEIRFLDAQVGAVLDELRARELLDNSIVIVTSDHGEEFHEHGGWLHGQTVYEELVRVPLFIAYPPLTPEARDVQATARLEDVVPTLLDLLRLPPRPMVHGRSLVPFLQGLAGDEDGAAPDVLIEGTISGHTAYRRGRYKLIRLRSPERVALQLFDLQADPGEREDLAAARPEMVQELLELMTAAERRHRASGIAPRSKTLDPAEEEAMRQLGYIR